MTKWGLSGTKATIGTSSGSGKRASGRRDEHIPRVDARVAAQRDIADFLRKQHLPGVDTDDDASVVLEVEQARLTLIASAGVIAFETSQLLGANRPVCVTPLYVSVALLFIAMVGAGIALIAAEHLRRFRVERRYRIYHGELREYLNAVDGTAYDRYPTDTEWSGQIRREGAKRRTLRRVRYAVAGVAALGIAAGLLAAIGTADTRRCHFEILKPPAKVA